MSGQVKQQERFHFLDGFRGIAIFMIVLAHAFMSAVVKLLKAHQLLFVARFFSDFMSAGLTLFFVLSGMVILRPYIRKERKFELLNYVRRRFVRLYPPFFVALVFGAFVVWFNSAFPTWYNERGLRMQFTWLEFFKEALVINFDGNYFNLAWWSLNVEIVFYVLAPFIIMTFPRADKINSRKFWVVTLSTLIIATLLQFYFTYKMPQYYSFRSLSNNVFLFLNFPLCFLIGAFLAIKDFTIKDAYTFIIVGMILILFSETKLPYLNRRFLPLASSGYAILSAGLITFGFRVKSFRDFWSKPILVWIGERSYSLYLTHFSVYYLTDNLVSRLVPERNIYYGILTRGLGIPFSFLIAILLFHFVEKRYTRGLVTDKAFWPWQINRLNLHADNNATAAPILQNPLKIESVQELT